MNVNLCDVRARYFFKVHLPILDRYPELPPTAEVWVGPSQCRVYSLLDLTVPRKYQYCGRTCSAQATSNTSTQGPGSLCKASLTLFF